MSELLESLKLARFLAVEDLSQRILAISVNFKAIVTQRCRSRDIRTVLARNAPLAILPNVIRIIFQIKHARDSVLFTAKAPDTLLSRVRMCSSAFAQQYVACRDYAHDKTKGDEHNRVGREIPRRLVFVSRSYVHSSSRYSRSKNVRTCFANFTPLASRVVARSTQKVVVSLSPYRTILRSSITPCGKIVVT